MDTETVNRGGTSSTNGRVYVQVIQGFDLDPPSAASMPRCFLTTFLDQEEQATRMRFKTKPASKGTLQNPEWGESLTLGISKPLTTLECSVWVNVAGSNNQVKNKDVGKEVLLGVCHFNTLQICDQSLHKQVFNLEPVYGEDSRYVGGRIELHVHFKYLPVWSDFFQTGLAVERKQWNVAYRYISQAIRVLPDEEILYEYRSIIHLNLRRYNDALADANRLVELCPNWSKSHLALGNVYFEMQELEKASQAYSTGLRLNPRDSEIKALLTTLRNMQTSDAVLAALREGKRAFDTRDLTLAESHFTRAIEENPSNPTLYLFRAIVRLAQDRVDDATADGLKIVHVYADWCKSGYVRQGYLEKKGARFSHTMKRRWFSLKDKFLYYFQDDVETRPNGLVCLHKCKIELRHGKPREIFIVTSKRVYELRAQSNDDRDAWASDLSKVIDSPLSLPDGDRVSLVFTTESGGLKLPNHKLIPKVAGNIARKLENSRTLVSINKQDYAGWVQKESDFQQKGWERRWLIKRAATLFFFEEEQEDNPQDVIPKGIIDNLNMASLKIVSERARTFEIVTESAVNRFRVDTEVEFEEWTQWLSRTCQVVDATVQIGPSSDGTSGARALRSPSVPGYLQSRAPMPPPRFSDSPNTDPSSERSSLGTRMSTSEARMYEKFGLNTPELVNFQDSSFDNQDSVPLLRGDGQLLGRDHAGTPMIEHSSSSGWCSCNIL